MGATMRLGTRPTHFVNTPALTTSQSVIQRLYGNELVIHERHRHRYEVNPRLVDKLE